MSKPERNDQIFVGATANNDVLCKCERCGCSYVIELPLSIEQFVKTSRAFIELHQCCKPPKSEAKTEKSQ